MWTSKGHPGAVPEFGSQRTVGKTFAVVATHLYGNVVDVGSARRMDKPGYAGVPIVEDCAQSHGARLGDRLTGTMGDIATFSFYPTKNFGAFGDGGAIVTNDAHWPDRARAAAIWLAGEIRHRPVRRAQLAHG